MRDVAGANNAIPAPNYLKTELGWLGQPSSCRAAASDSAPEISRVIPPWIHVNQEGSFALNLPAPL